ncbi:hypothetical protein [Spiroplasma endosymbiont of Nephrotoma flavescens]|uniref:hypothetical protein n=1 Tax=Spiroplasma endosymbiont of Nephrotoma flavescens TaxID=3066302 RepID=UPI00313C3478
MNCDSNILSNETVDRQLSQLPIFSSDNSTQQEQLGCPLIDLMDFTINTNSSNYSEIELNKKITNDKKTQENTQSEAEKGILEDILKLEEETAKVAEQMLAQKDRERQVREQRQQWLTE